ncbi:MAG: c-type cytochrome, partial [Planctomycetales bacterium]|nr:c-type cytochrome [Planctomycetales bacterium]
HPDEGYGRATQFGVGIGGQTGNRNSPVSYNRILSGAQFWDGRADSLEAQAVGPIANPIEMNLPLDEMVRKVSAIKGYAKPFERAFGTPEVTQDRVAKAIASFERTVLSGDAPYDRYKAGDQEALSEPAKRGMKLFFGKANCSACHSGHSFTDGGFHNLGVGIKDAEPDVGRFAVSKQEGDKGSFKTPTLREIARTAPYMHDGRLKTLEEVVDYYDKGGEANPQLDEEIYALKLTAEQKADLVAFLKEGLSSEAYPDVKEPKLPE